MKIININADKSHGILEKCGVLKEYSYEDELEVTRQETFETGLEKGEAMGKVKGEENGIILARKIFQEIQKNPHFTNHQVVKNVECTIETVKKARKSFSL